MKNVYTFDFFFDADLASRGITKRKVKMESILRWADEEDKQDKVEQEQASRANVRDVFNKSGDEVVYIQ